MKKTVHSFADRVTRWILLVWIVFMTLVAFLVFSVVELGMIAQAQAHYDDTLQLTDEKVATMLKSVEVSTYNIREGVERAMAGGKDIYAALQNELGLNPDLTGCAVAFTEDSFPDRGRWFEPYVVRLPDGTFEHRQIGSATHDYFQSPWYKEAIVREEGYWSDPYFDEVGARMMLSTYSLPIHDATGRVRGVCCADVSLGWLRNQMREINDNVNARGVLRPGPEDVAYSFILARDGGYVSHPDSTRVMTRSFFDDYDPVLSRGDTTYLQVGREMVAGLSGVKKAVVDGVPSLIYYDPLDWIGWSVGIVVPRANLVKPGVAMGMLVLGLMFLGMIVVFLVSRYTIRRAARPIQELAHSAGEVAKGHFDTPLPEIRYDDEVRLLRDSFSDMEKNLKKYVRELTAATAQKASFESELAIAREIQLAMLPADFKPGPGTPHLDIAATLAPARAVGGDLYDFFFRDGRLFFCIGDVSGKGIPAALIMSMTSSLFRSLSMTEDVPERIVSGIDVSTEGRNDSLMFVTLFVGILDLATGALSYCNAGHTAPVLVGKDIRALAVEPNVPVGAVEGWTFKSQRTTLDPGTTLLLYTDGLTEAANVKEELFGEERLVLTLRKLDDNASEKVVAGLTQAVRHFVGKAEQSDDLTLLAIRYKG